MGTGGSPGGRSHPRIPEVTDGVPPSAEGLAFLQASAAAAEAEALWTEPSDLRPGDHRSALGLVEPEYLSIEKRQAQRARIRKWKSHGSPPFYMNLATDEFWYYDKSGNRVIVFPDKSTEATENVPDEQIEARKAAIFGRLTVILSEIDEAQTQAQAWVDRARELGATWREIGEATNVSPQAAHTRWSPQGREQNRKRQERLRRRATNDPDD